MSRTSSTKAKVSLASMTGFGRSTFSEDGLHLDIEIKSSNHRFLDVSFKLPRAYNQFESDLKLILSERLQRGRVEVYVSRTVKRDGRNALKFEKDLFDSLLKKVLETGKSQKVAGVEFRRRAVLDLLSRREILELEEGESNADHEKPILLKAFESALQPLERMRFAEGESLAHDIQRRLENLFELRNKIAETAKSVPQNLKERFDLRIKKLTQDITVDPLRLAQEIAIAIDRLDITEELVRLDSHLKQGLSAIHSGPVGRKLDFLLQEFGREFNTIGSKAQDATIQSYVVEAKVELEKIREQVQNLV